MEKIIRYLGEQVKVGCDDKCNKAWGINSRPKMKLSVHDEDDIVWLSDTDIKKDAPEDPHTYEGGDGKPSTDDEKPNKWCVRECERCAFANKDGKLTLPDYSKKVYNQPQKHGEK